MTEFDAKCFAMAALDDLNALVIVFASNADGTGHWIELLRSIEPDEQEASLGMDTYCICLSRRQENRSTFRGTERHSKRAPGRGPTRLAADKDRVAAAVRLLERSPAVACK